MSDIIIGGAIALCGGIATQVVTHHLKTRTEKREKEKERLIELLAALSEYDSWLEQNYQRLLLRNGAEKLVNPFYKIKAIGLMYFLKLYPNLIKLSLGGSVYMRWMNETSLSRLNNTSYNSGIEN
jgi:hypothetical protein